MGRSLRLPSSTSSPSRNTMVRNPSHLGSKLQGPSGRSETGLASIGATRGITGRTLPSSIKHVAFVLWRAQDLKLHERKIGITPFDAPVITQDTGGARSA